MAVTIKNGKFWFNGKRKDFVLGRSSFKLANIVSYHYTGQGGKYPLSKAYKWITHNQAIFGKDVVLRVFLETAGWDPNSNGMFGSVPQDQGVWGNRDALRDGNRTKKVPPVLDKVLEWFFRASTETGCAFELVIDATLKHDDIPRGEIDHAIRVVGVRMGELQKKYPKALIVPETRNEWNAHAQTPLQDVNMWAERWWRDQYWPNAPLIVSPGGSNVPTYKIGGNGYRAAIIHPERGAGWENVPNNTSANLRRLAKGLPIGYNESMYLVEKEDLDRVRQWYRPSGWTADFGKYKRFFENARDHIDYFIVHDEKGAQCDPEWPRPSTRLERYIKATYGTGEVEPDPDPEPTPDPIEPPPGNQWKMLFELLKLLGLNLEDFKGFVGTVERELSARGKQLDRMEATLGEILSAVQSDTSSADPIDPGPGEPNKKPNQYIPWEQRFTWAERVEEAYSVDRGDRDLSYFIRNGGKYWGDIKAYTLAEAQKHVEWMHKLHLEQQRLIYRITTEEHRKYEGRSQVRRDVANALISRLNEATDVYSQYPRDLRDKYGPVGWDSLRGFLNSRG
jgi:hypothetical protein